MVPQICTPCFFNHIPFPGVVEARAPLGPPRGHGEERANVHVATEDQGAVPLWDSNGIFIV